MVHPAQTASPPRLPRLCLAAPCALTRQTRGHIFPSPTPELRGCPCFCTPWGKSPGHAAVCGEPVTLRLSPTLPLTESELGIAAAPRARADPVWPSRRAGAHVRTQARNPASSSLVPHILGAWSRGLIAPRQTREAAREPGSGCVSRRCRVLYAAREPAPPAQRSQPAAAAASG